MKMTRGINLKPIALNRKLNVLAFCASDKKNALHKDILNTIFGGLI